MTNTPPNADVEAALAGVEQAIAQIEGCDPAERDALIAELRELRDLADKLKHERVEIAVFGEISTGKSALINALAGRDVAGVSVRGGWTKEVWRLDWEAPATVTPGLEESGLVLVDTPGLNEVDGEQRADMARDAAERADLVLLVTDSDLNETEFSALEQIASLHKPILLVVNKIDLYTEDELADLKRSLTSERVTKLVGGEENVVFASADPRETEYLIEQPDGSTRSEWRQPEPNIEGVRARVLELLVDEGKTLVALNAAMYAADRSDRVAALRVRMRSNRADQVVWSYAGAKALAVAMNPWAVADVAGGVAVDVAMVATLAGVYGIPITTENARDLVLAITKAAGWLVLGELLVSAGSSFFKGVTFGGSTVLTAIPQGAAAGYGSYLVGQAARYYFEQGGSWGEGGPKRVVTKILENLDKASIVDRLKDEIRQKLSRNKHGAEK
ncbi:GTPase Era [Planctomycetes bacterium MalM25]|nr:GTPase Era [Planctomycetes bacterium MalM25]